MHIIRYECPKSGYRGAYALLNTESRYATGYYSDNSVRWASTYISTEREQGDIAAGTWVLPEVPLDQQLPEGF